MPATNIIPFPTCRRDPLYRGRPQHRAAVRFSRILADPRQAALPLPAPNDLDARILAAKATAGNYEELAAKAERPVTKVLLAGLAARWHGRVLALVIERDSRTGQGELLPSVPTTPNPEARR